MTMLFEPEGTLNDVIGPWLSSICKQVERAESILSKLQRQFEEDGLEDFAADVERALDELSAIQSDVEDIDAEAREVETEALDVARTLFTPDPNQWTYSERMLLAELASGLAR